MDPSAGWGGGGWAADRDCRMAEADEERGWVPGATTRRTDRRARASGRFRLQVSTSYLSHVARATHGGADEGRGVAH